MRLFLALLDMLLLSQVLLSDIAPIPGTQAVNPVFDEADVVCNCLVESLRVVDERKQGQQGKPLIWQHVVATVHILDLYKTPDSNSVTLQVEFEQELPPTRASMPAPSKGETALLFLKASEGSLYGFADPFLGATPFASIRLEHGPLGLLKLQSALAAVARQGTHDDQIRAMRLLQGMDKVSADALTQLTSLSASSDPDVALSAIAALLKSGSPDSVERLQNYLLAYEGNAHQPFALISIGTELGQITDSKALPTLEALASSKYLSIRFGAVDALRYFKNPNSSSVLVQRLDDPDSNLRYVAVITLAETFGKSGDYAPTMNLFDAHPDFYTNLWKTWWTSEGKSLSEAASV
jgi:hypothetical protein